MSNDTEQADPRVEQADADAQVEEVEEVDEDLGATATDEDEADLEDDDEDEQDDEDDEDDEGPADLLEQEGDIAADYLEELLDIADLDGDLDMDVEGDRAMVSIVGADLQQLVGRNGEVLDALQELTRLAVYRETGERSRLMLDVSGYRARRREELVALAEETVRRVRESGDQVSLTPMSPFERKVVHDAVAAAGLTSESEGVEPRRFVVVLPA
ncbi:protein jag [Nocardioides taihuensis]|uniref:Protein jag n=1 Tax=Nocardioides taihuensis TaxID=1835606 RepID=A0ABW0BGA6_9ACTN